MDEEKVVLVPISEDIDLCRADSRFRGFQFYSMDNLPAYHLEGARFKEIWISRWCFKEAGYQECLDVIFQSIANSQHPQPAPKLF